MSILGSLSAEEIGRYRNDGYLVPQFRFEGQALAKLQGLAENLLEQNTHLGDAPMVCPHMPSAGVQGLKGDAAWLSYSTDEAVLNSVESLIGPNIILWGTNLFHKPASKGRRIPFHRDGRYWPVEPLSTVTVWIAVEDCDVGNGCLRVIPGSNRAGVVGEHFTSDDPGNAIPETLRAEEFEANTAVNVVLKAGQMVMFDVYTIHGSEPNQSDRRRLGYAMRYMPSTSRFHHDGAERRELSSNAHDTRPLFLVRGVDQCGTNDFRRGHPDP